MSEITREQLLLRQWEVASELHRHEGSLAWQKFNIFIAVNGILLTVLAVVWSREHASYCALRVPSIAICFFGALTSIIWGLLQRRGQLYQNYRIAQAREAEGLILVEGDQVLNLYQKGLNEQKLVPPPRVCRFGTHTLVVLLSVVMGAVWLSLVFWFGSP